MPLPFGLNNPLPRDLDNEAKKAANILRSFVKPNQVLGEDQIIPPKVLQNAKGLAIITVIKAGFLFSGRAGSGVIVAKQGGGYWSAPSAIALAGAGAGGMVGVELTDFVFILNTEEAVQSFSEFGTITLGGNVSVSAGPLGRNAEYDASASTGGIATVYSYSKSKGLFAGISVEGSAIIERRETNRKMYGDNCTTKLILSGRVDPPFEYDALYSVLDSRAFNAEAKIPEGKDFYDDIPDDFNCQDIKNNKSRSNMKSHITVNSSAEDGIFSDLKFNDNKEESSIISDNISTKKIKVLALYDFDGVEKTDLPFKKGDIIEVIKRTKNQEDWWYGTVNGKVGNFPANYCSIQK
ncbi:similar to Saccharomyces cerevisiae YHR016C YSC84 Actin-binding protein involved in bundling of actin filaments and endocytosis of actin cortical patches [Maudiozyma saulgeensis]|uniref:Similar to Saccharomyces cerevisiae YHR016C YSC84 Actin-binding protein involved in bundling of actin filaments and endocytosis of actin cortical patches n=1 Tax=Maudiozyma saulgeensis TaxID=1789683 RepID=A0A1X7R0I3_9SACH|nr:similar to Saccharomyces cerevisiae YHR016C YSC84 Actin-binding protein involved in bundling of actin filaments and endocytosis of actin cortical patches [Kazachstania saulgeensis]